MVSALLFYLPESKRYKVIFMKRRMEEMLASQNAMLERKGLKDDKVSDEEMAEKFQKHLAKVEDWIRKRSYIEVIHVDYNEVIRNPHENAAVVNRFLGGRLNTDRMAGIVETSLYRQRK